MVVQHRVAVNEATQPLWPLVSSWLPCLPACLPASLQAELPGYLGSKQAWRPGGHALSLDSPPPKCASRLNIETAQKAFSFTIEDRRAESLLIDPRKLLERTEAVRLQEEGLGQGPF